MIERIFLIIFILINAYTPVFAIDEHLSADIVINRQDTTKKEELSFAEPVFSDFITDLGGPSGRIIANGNFFYKDFDDRHNTLTNQIELEVAPVNRLGVEVVLPYKVHLKNANLSTALPDNRIPYFQWGLQYAFLVSHESKFVLAANYSNRFEFKETRGEEEAGISSINHFPFLIAAKNWHSKYFLTGITGVKIIDQSDSDEINSVYHITGAFHQQFSDKHLWGVELNNEYDADEEDFDMLIRPQVIFEFTDKIQLGTALGIPAFNSSKNWSALARLSYVLRE